MSILVIGEMSPEAYAKAKALLFEDGFNPRDIFPLALHQFYMVDDVVIPVAVDAIIVQRSDLSVRTAQDYFPDLNLEEAQHQARRRTRILLEQIAQVNTQTPVYIINLGGDIQRQPLDKTLLASFFVLVS